MFHLRKRPGLFVLDNALFRTIGNGKEGECRCQADYVRITVERVLFERDREKIHTVSSVTIDKTAFGELPKLVRKETIIRVLFFPLPEIS